MSPFTLRDPDSELMSGWVRKHPRLGAGVGPGSCAVLQAGALGTGRGSSKTQGMMDGGLNAT